MTRHDRPQKGRPAGVGTQANGTPEPRQNRVTPPPRPTTRARIEPANAIGPCAYDIADVALTTGMATGCPDCPLVAVPDVLVVERIANGDEVPQTYRLLRGDGRSAWIYTRPEVVK